ncbi:DNA glycosylase [Podospora didyma]|uniref:DNA glycosylase n=1 Tax=Podospora didyma TaxID=330526 RepID=A0AAE0P840_9PEZI|nr:DNA glycosylase [Podospora didyma]
MDRAYNLSSVTSMEDKWTAIVSGGQAKLQAAIQCGGLSAVKSRVIINILEQVHARYGVYSLEHLHSETDEDAIMRELLSFKGVGPKTASCVLLFCLGRHSFAVDTHVWRITGLLRWRPREASRDETHLHLDARIPDEEKYGLHVLLVTHGKRCAECKAGGRDEGKCPLRREFKKKAKKTDEEGEDDEKAKKEEETSVKVEDIEEV